MILYLGAREVSVPWTTAETHSAPNRAFQNGTICVGLGLSKCGGWEERKEGKERGEVGEE